MKIFILLLLLTSCTSDGSKHQNCRYEGSKLKPILVCEPVVE